jgi:hypothetical protein
MAQFLVGAMGIFFSKVSRHALVPIQSSIQRTSGPPGVSMTLITCLHVVYRAWSSISTPDLLCGV